MGQAARKSDYTAEEYLEIEETSEHKNEFFNGEIFAMAGGSRNHSVICVNLNWKLAEATAEKDCIVFDSNMKLHISEPESFVYPDVTVVCGKIEFYKNRTDVIRNPTLIIEVLSPSTQVFDKGKKFEYYRSIPSVREYVLVSQEEPMVEVYYRQDNKTWLYSFAKGVDDAILLQTIPYQLALKDVYKKVLML